MSNHARDMLSRVVNRCIAEGSPVVMEQREHTPESAGWPKGELADARQRGRDDAIAGKPSIGLSIHGQAKSQAYIEGYYSVE